MVNRNIRDLATATAYDKDGDKLGSVREVYINDATGQPDFIEVSHGLFGMSSSLVPLRGHQFSGDELRLAFSKDRIAESPKIDDDARLSDEEQAVIYRHYGLEGTENRQAYEADPRPADRDRVEDRSDREAGAQTDNVEAYEADPRPAGRDRVEDRSDRSDRETGAPTDNVEAFEADPRPVKRDRVEDRSGAADRSGRTEGSPHVEEGVPEGGQVRLRRYIVEDTETIEVPVRREEIRIERIPAGDEDTQVEDPDPRR